jgi:chemotaxis protein CheC
MDLTGDQMDALKELVNIGVGRAARVLNTMLHSHVRLRVPFVEILSPSALKEEMQRIEGETLSAVQLTFKGPLSGIALLVFPTESAAKLVAILTDDKVAHSGFDSIRTGTLTEVGNIVLNGVMGVVGNELEQRIYYSVPTYAENPIQSLLAPSGADASATVIWAQARFTVERHQIDGDIILLIEVGSFDVLLNTINREIGVQP